MSGICKAEMWLQAQPIATDGGVSNLHDQQQNVESLKLKTSMNSVNILEDESGDAGRQRCDIPPDQLSQSGSEEEEVPWCGVERMVVLKQLVRALLSLCSVVATQQSGVTVLRNMGIVEKLLDM